MATTINPNHVPYMPLKVCYTFEDYKKTALGMGFEPSRIGNLTGVTSYENSVGCVVFVPETLDDLDFLSIAAHESVHAARALLSSIGEKKPGHEQMAYLVQSIFDGIVFNSPKCKAEGRFGK